MSKSKFSGHVKGGKTRAATSLRDSKGRFTTNIFKREVLKTVAASKGFDVSKDERAKDKAIIDKVIKDAGITQSELNKAYKQNIEVFSDMLQNGGLKTTFKNANQIADAIDKYKGKITVSSKGVSKQMTKTEARFRLDKFKQFLSTSVNASDFSIRMQLGFDGKLDINIPDADYLRERYEYEIDDAADDKELMQSLIEDIQDEFDNNEDVVIYGS